MIKRAVPIIIGLALLGAACTEPLELVETPTLYGAPSPEGFVAFNEGLGLIPGPIPEPPARAGFDPAIEWATDLPAHPTEVTVLRMHQTLPNPSFLQNITTALRIPAGALQTNPAAEVMRMQWRDEDGYRWSFDAEENRVRFERIGTTDALTANALPTNDELVSIAQVFLTERGADRGAWGTPQLTFSWNDWWLDMQQADRCMTTASINAIRNIAQNDPRLSPALPTLPFRTNVSCSEPEFPAQHVIVYHLTQDGQDVFDENGERVTAAELVVDAGTKTIRSGWFDLVQDVDRSNYPVLPLKEAIAKLQRGGLRGTRGYGTADVITITSFERGLYRHDVQVDGVRRTYFIPGIYAEGEAVRASGGKEEFRTFVPLLREDEYAE